MRKLRILCCNEFSMLNTGYSRYGHEVLSRLYDTGKYVVAEQASYIADNDPRIGQVPWRVYANSPRKENQDEVNRHNSDPSCHFGAWRFEEACLDFKPDCCFSIRDTWMYSHELSSPFRQFYYHAAMPTCDSMPQDEGWIAQFMDSDAVFTYTDWAKDTIKNQSNGMVNPIRSLSPGVDFTTYKPFPNRAELRSKFSIGNDMIIIGTIMRNQKRKKYPDLFKAFEKFLEHCEAHNKDLGHRTFLYLHTSYPDLGWDIPRLLKESNIGHKVLFTYVCKNCHAFYPSFWADTRSFCPNCKQYAANLPGTQAGLQEGALAAVYNLFDVYVQYANSEGIGIPLVEAAGCGVPVMAINYSGMVDVLKKCKGIPVNYLHLDRESETHAYRAIPDNNHFVEQLYKFLTLPESMRRKKGIETHELAKRHFNWTNTAVGWIECFDKVIPRKLSETWKSPPRIFQPNLQVPGNLNMSSFIDWAIVNVLGMPEKLNTHFALRLVRDLVYEARQPGFGGNMYLDDQSFTGMMPKWEHWTPETTINYLLQIRNNYNSWEQIRAGLMPYEKPEWLRNVKLSERQEDNDEPTD